MGLFNKPKIEFTKNDIEKINAIIPVNFRREVWNEKDFDENGIVSKVRKHSYNLHQTIKTIKSKIDFIPKKDYADKIIIYNTEIIDAKPFGMVDIGVVERFNATTSGNRFENGAIGYAIEGIFDDVWSKNNAQFESISKVKSLLLQKSKTIYPECNLLFKFQIDFQELGNSGNFFIYARATACKGVNQIIENQIKKDQEELEELKKELIQKEEELKFIQDNLYKIPDSKNKLKSFLEKE